MSRIPTGAHVLRVLRMRLLLMMIMLCLRWRTWTIDTTGLSGSGLELTYGSSRKMVISRLLMGGLSNSRRLVLVLMLIRCGLRINIR